MNKGLAKRIGEQTRKVVEEREAQLRAENRAYVWSVLSNRLTSMSNEGEDIYFNEERTELDFDIYNVKDLTSTEVKIALLDLGFEISTYPMRIVPAIPKNVPDSISELINLCDTLFMRYKYNEEDKAESDVEEVMRLLDEGKYDILSVNRIRVYYESKSESSCYTARMLALMAEEGFTVEYYTKDNWTITIPEEEDD